VTGSALLFGVISSFSLNAIIYIGTRFVLPNVLVALLFRAYFRRRSARST
jgi:hypothetical protein